MSVANKREVSITVEHRGDAPATDDGWNLQAESNQRAELEVVAIPRSTRVKPEIPIDDKIICSGRDACPGFCHPNSSAQATQKDITVKG